jgi:hypothetical protein
MDNIQRLTFVMERPRKFILELDERLLLIFTELETVKIEGPEHVFADYKQLVLFCKDWAIRLITSPCIAPASTDHLRLGLAGLDLALYKGRITLWPS